MKGCCWGTPIGEEHPFHGLSVKLVRNSLLTLHPVQLYSAAAALAIFCILLALRRRSKTPGLLAVFFLLLYAAARFFLEFFRGDTPALFAGLTLSQGICILLFLAGSFLLFLRLRQTRDEGSGVRVRSPTPHDLIRPWNEPQLLLVLCCEIRPGPSRGAATCIRLAMVSLCVARSGRLAGSESQLAVRYSVSIA